MKIDTEVKNYISVMIGDIDVKVNIEYKPRSYVSTKEEIITLHNVNMMLSRLAGELQYELRDMIEEKVKKLK